MVLMSKSMKKLITSGVSTEAISTISSNNWGSWGNSNSWSNSGMSNNLSWSNLGVMTNNSRAVSNLGGDLLALSGDGLLAVLDGGDVNNGLTHSSANLSWGGHGDLITLLDWDRSTLWSRNSNWSRVSIVSSIGIGISFSISLWLSISISLAIANMSSISSNSS